MSLRNDVLLFDKEQVTEEQIMEHVQHYYDLANKGMSLLETNRKEAMACLKEIRKTMTLEYRYYDKSKVQAIMWANNLYNTYYHYIRDAFVKQTNPTAYESLGSNLYDVLDYARYYYGGNLKDK